MTTLTIEQLSEKLNGSLWVKGDMKRIYLNDAGWNTKKMSTKTFVFQDENGNFKVSCKVDCSSQPWQWCKSQEDEVKESIYEDIQNAISTISGFSEIEEGNIDTFVGQKIEWKAPAAKGNEPYAGIAIIKSLTNKGVVAEYISGDDLNYAFWDLGRLSYSDEYRYISCKIVTND